jgi:hypothetical protein
LSRSVRLWWPRAHDEDPPKERAPGLRDPTGPGHVPGLVHPRRQAGPRGEVLRRREAVEVADLADDDEGGVERHARHRHEPSDVHAPSGQGGHPLLHLLDLLSEQEDLPEPQAEVHGVLLRHAHVLDSASMMDHLDPFQLGIPAQSGLRPALSRMRDGNRDAPLEDLGRRRGLCPDPAGHR